MASSYSAEVPSKFPLLLSRLILFSLTIIMPGTALSNSAKISDALAAFPLKEGSERMSSQRDTVTPINTTEETDLP